MFRRAWTPAVIEGSNNESKIHVYDFGVYCGELIEDNWTCWEILSRTKNEAGEIVEELRKMPQDWVPFEDFTCETYMGTSTADMIHIRGWSIRTTEIPPLEKLSNHPPKVEKVIKQHRPRVQQQQRPQGQQQQRPQGQQQQRPPQQRPQGQQQRPQGQQQRPPQQRQAGAPRTVVKPVYNISQTKPPHRIAQVDQWTPLVNLVAPI